MLLDSGSERQTSVFKQNHQIHKLEGKIAAQAKCWFIKSSNAVIMSTEGTTIIKHNTIQLLWIHSFTLCNNSDLKLSWRKITSSNHLRRLISVWIRNKSVEHLFRLHCKNSKPRQVVWFSFYLSSLDIKQK